MNVSATMSYVLSPEEIKEKSVDELNEILKQLFATRRNFQKAEQTIQSLKARLVQMQEALGVMQEVVAEGLSES